MSYIKQGDCLDLMQEIQDNSIDMILCDLPYEQTHNEWDTIIPFDKLWEQYNRIIKDNGAILLFASNLFMGQVIMSNSQMFRYTLVWDKVRTTGFLNANRMPLRRHEDICVFYKKLPTYNPQMVEGGEPSHSRGKNWESQGVVQDDCKIYGKYNHTDKTACNMTNLKFPTSIITVSNNVQNNLHPTQKPVKLLQYLIKTYTNENEVVLDNCMGSGSTIIACINTNRQYIGFEKEEKYFKIAEERIHQKLKDEKQKLF